MEDALLLKGGEKWEERIGWRVIVKEMKSVGYLAGPMVAVNLSQFLLQVVSVIMLGRLGSLSLSSSSIAMSLAGITGWSLLSGMASALETLSGQTYGAQQYEKLGTQTYTAIFSLIIACVPLSMFWMFMENVLKFSGQDPLISHEAGKFMTWLVPALFGYAALQPLVRYYQMQSLIISPMVISACVTICFHAVVSWVLVFKSGLEYLGAAVAMDLSIWLDVMILALYMKYSRNCQKTRAPVSIKTVLGGVRMFFRFAIPSAVMTCLEWWSFELLILLAGLLPNPQLETSVLSVCLNTAAILYTIPYGLSAAASTRISNELGGGKPEEALILVIALMILAAINATVISASLFASRHVFGYIFSNDKRVMDYVSDMAPFVCLSVITDSIQGVARGSGWQHIGVYFNLIAFYLVGIPVGVALGFWFNLRGKGLWIGILSGSTLQTFYVGHRNNLHKLGKRGS